MTRERRRRSRVSLEIPLLVAVEGKKIRGVVQDISLKGLSCVMEAEPRVGAQCDVTLNLESGLRISIHGRIIRSGQDGVIDFLHMDEESFAHLRNLIRIYSEDADAVDDELLIPAFAPEEPSPK